MLLRSEFSYFSVLLKNVIQDVKELTVLLFLHRDMSKLRSVPEMAFYGLQLLCLPKHGDQKEVRSNNHGPSLVYYVDLSKYHLQEAKILNYVCPSMAEISSFPLFYTAHCTLCNGKSY